jgi:hypothetical protein
MDTHMSFSRFYTDVFLAEHRAKANIAMHVIGTFAGLALLIFAGTAGPIWWALAFPVIHALPGLVGHRLFERNDEVGDLRVTRTDYSPLWFIAANHRMTFELLFRGWYWRGAAR